MTRRIPSILAIEPMKAVHFTYWSLVNDLPYNGPPQVVERPRHPWLVWGSVFNADIDPYIEAFLAVVGKQIRFTWGRAYGFPGTDSVATLRDYIVALSLRSRYRYSAYPEDTVRTILSAMEIEREHKFLLEAAATLPPESFATVYRGFLTRQQEDL